MLLFGCFGVIHIFMSVNIAERPAFEKELYILIEVCLHYFVYFLYSLRRQKFESDCITVTCKQLISPNVLLLLVTVYQCVDSIDIIL